MQKLGQGTYGSVVAQGNSAVKKFHKLSHLIQEYMAGTYLSDASHVVRVKGVDFRKLELAMDLHEMSLRGWLEKNSEPCHEIRMGLLKDIVIGLVELHERGLVHGDLKPGNVLVSHDGQGVPHAVLGDLGFVSLAPYSKVERTALVYRDTHIVHGPEHDMYSLGIIMFELFADYRLKQQPDYSQLHKIVRKKVRDRKMCDLIIDLTDSVHRHRPSALEVLNKVFGEHRTPSLRRFPSLAMGTVSSSEEDRIITWMKSSAKLFKIKRAKRGARALINFLGKYEVKKKDHHVYATGMMMILSSIFGATGFQEDHIFEACDGKYAMDEIIGMIDKMLKDRDLVVALMLP